MSSVAYLKINANTAIAYYQLAGKTPGIIFCCGFMSDMHGIKARFVESFCRKQGLAFVRFDYRGHGQSKGNIQEANISLWLTDALAVLDNLTQGPQMIVGSSMGAWLGILMAKARPERVRKLISIAAAPDFTEDLIWARLPKIMQDRLLQNEVLHFPSQYDDKPYIVTRQFIEDGRKNLILRAPIAIQCSVHLLHGMQDHDIAWQTSMKLAEQLQSHDVQLTLIKAGDHRLSRDQDLVTIQQVLSSSLLPDKA